MKVSTPKGVRKVTVEEADIRVFTIAKAMAKEFAVQLNDADAVTAAEALERVIEKHRPKAKPAPVAAK